MTYKMLFYVFVFLSIFTSQAHADIRCFEIFSKSASDLYSFQLDSVNKRIKDISTEDPGSSRWGILFPKLRAQNALSKQLALELAELRATKEHILSSIASEATATFDLTLEQRQNLEKKIKSSKRGLDALLWIIKKNAEGRSEDMEFLHYSFWYLYFSPYIERANQPYATWLIMEHLEGQSRPYQLEKIVDELKFQVEDYQSHPNKASSSLGGDQVIYLMDNGPKPSTSHRNWESHWDSESRDLTTTERESHESHSHLREETHHETSHQDTTNSDSTDSSGGD